MTTNTLRMWWVGVIAWIAFLAVMPRVCGAQFAAYEEPSVMTDREFAGYVRLCGPTGVQATAAESLHTGAKQEVVRQIEASREAVAWWNEIPREKRTQEQRAKVMRDLKEHEPDIKGLRVKLLKDLQAVLDEPQRERWRRFEYFLRRERWLSHHNEWNVPDPTNLLGMVDRLQLDEPSRSAIAEMLARYERELDAVLTDIEREFERMSAAQSRVWQRGPEASDADRTESEKAGMAWERAHHTFISLNDDFCSRIAAALPDGKSKELRSMFERIALSEAYGVRAGPEGVLAAPTLRGLDDQTREKVVTLVAEFRKTWDEQSAKIAAMERKLRNARFGDAVDLAEWDPIRMDRSDRLGKTHLKLKELLNERQFEQMLHEGGRREREWKDSMSR